MAFSFGWEPLSCEPNQLQSILSHARGVHFSFVSVPVQVQGQSNPRNDADAIARLVAWQGTLIASSDRSLAEASDWATRVLLRIPASHPDVTALLEYAGHMGVFAVLVEDWTLSTARAIVQWSEAHVVPFSLYFRSLSDNWLAWRELHCELTETERSVRFGVVIQVSQLTERMASVWQAEPLRGVVIPGDGFVCNAKGHPVLPKHTQRLLTRLYTLAEPVPVILTGDLSDMSDRTLYLRWLLDPERLQSAVSAEQRAVSAFAAGFENVLQTPLQPLRDHLPSETYEVFERDPVKYQQYQTAIALALSDLKRREQAELVSESPVPLRVGVFGAGRGPLVQAALDAAIQADCPIALVIVEKNPNACLTLLDRFRHVPNISLIHGDMRRMEDIPAGSLHLIVSELLGSFSDNELSPECLWPVERLLVPHGICIPQSYTSFLTPCYAPLLHGQVSELARQGDARRHCDPFGRGYVTHITRAFLPTSRVLPAFTFAHQAPFDETTHESEASCHAVFTDLDAGCMIDGLIGYFESRLYDHVSISTVPARASPGMFSWFPMYFPLRRPVTVAADGTLEADMRRRRDGERIWYEWRVAKADWQNENGDAYSLHLE